MSVQGGIWNFDGAPVNRETLVRFGHSRTENGLDGEATYLTGPIGLLYRAFHTTAQSRLERQPYFFANGKVITWDGRLDNRDELMVQLGDSLKADTTDVAIVAAAFERWGTDCFAKVIGDWALAVWDPRARELILARDYLGIRHLFYYPTSKNIVWCSHLRPLALCGGRFTLSDEYVAGYLASSPDAHLTPYQEIHAVPPGKFLKIRSWTMSSLHSYWTFNPRIRTRYKDDAGYEEHYRHLFRQAVRRRLRADSPILADLSGGLDSSSIVCMADDILNQEGAETPRVDTFSFYDSTEPGDDDLPYFTKVEEKRGKTGFHAQVQASGSSISFGSAAYVERPGLGMREEVKAALSEILERNRYGVMLSGRGGDDVNGQGIDPRIQMADMMLQLRFFEAAKALTAWSSLIRTRPWIQLFFQTLLQLTPVPVRARFTPYAKVDTWVNAAFARKHKMSARQMWVVPGPAVLRPSARDAMQTIGTLSRQMSSAAPCATETWYPYLDQDLVEFLTSIPLDQLLRPGHRRSLMRRALAHLLPAEVLARTTKAGPGRCYAVTLEKNWGKVESILSNPISSRLGYLDKDGLRDALFAMKNGQSSEYVLRLLNALSLELWLQHAQTRGLLSIDLSTPHPCVPRLATPAPRVSPRAIRTKTRIYGS